MGRAEVLCQHGVEHAASEVRVLLLGLLRLGLGAEVHHAIALELRQELGAQLALCVHACPVFGAKLLSELGMLEPQNCWKELGRSSKKFFECEHALRDIPHHDVTFWLGRTCLIPAGMYASQMWGTGYIRKGTFKNCKCAT
eukprot:scaffold11279_cov19-Tisochrysis_lutea.AAC.1